MFKLECHVIDRNPDFQMQERDYLRRIDWEKGPSPWAAKGVPHAGYQLPHVDPSRPGRTAPDEQLVLRKLVQSFRQSERLQQHEFSVRQGQRLPHRKRQPALPRRRAHDQKGTFAVERFEGHSLFRAVP